MEEMTFIGGNGSKIKTRLERGRLQRRNDGKSKLASNQIVVATPSYQDVPAKDSNV